jgi:uncharacterized protein (DUF2236 family)
MNKDEGYFPKDSSVLRRVHEAKCVGLLYGQRALLIGGTDPRNYVGTSEHTRDKTMPFKRLARTAKSFETIYFGSCAEADALLARVYQAHSHVKGTLAETAGSYPAGTPYSALDPDMMLWTVACIADSAQTLYETLVQTLSDEDRETLWQDYLRFGELFGMPRKNAPPTYADYRLYFEGRLNSGELHLTSSAKYMGKQVCFNLPLPFMLRPAQVFVKLLLLGTVPERIRELYSLSWNPFQEGLFKMLVSMVHITGWLMPKTVKQGYNTRFFNIVAAAEEKLKVRGKTASMPENPFNDT